MTQTVTYNFEFAVGYLNTPHDAFGTGDNIEIAVELTYPTNITRDDLNNVIKPIDHKHLHREAPDWRESNEPIAYGLNRVLQAALFLMRENPQLKNQLASVQIETGIGQVLLFEQKL